MGLSEDIADFIRTLLTSSEGGVELQRNVLASQFNCVPSQINYVLSTRFTNRHGYVVESRRGGGGFIRITRISGEGDDLLSHVINSIGSFISAQSAASVIAECLEESALTQAEAGLILSATGDNVLILPQPQRDEVRAKILKNMLTCLQV